MAKVLHLFVAVAHGHPTQEVEVALAVADLGLKGCAHGRAGSRRQVLLMDAETLEVLELRPGVVKENITTDGLEVMELKGGQRVRVGEALLEVTVPCTPCHKMDEIRAGLQDELRGRRGMLCRVVEAGRIRRGDEIEALN